MTDITDIFGGPYIPPQPTPPIPPEQQLRDAMQAAGLTPPAEIYLDGKLRRFRSGTRGAPGHSDKPGWYVAWGDGVPAGRFGCWRAGVEQTFRANVNRPLTVIEEMAHAARLKEAADLREAERRRIREAVADTVETIWTTAQGASPDHPYLARKKIGTHGARVTGDGRLVVPLYSPDGTLTSLQYIDHAGGKLYHSGGQTGGCFWLLGVLDEPGTIYIAEGFATAATIHEATGRPCIAAYSASNIVPVTGTIRAQLGASQDIVIVADNDASGVGQKYADQAAAKHGARVVMPPIIGDANDYALAGHDLKLLLSPPAKDQWLIPADDFARQPMPVSWAVKSWIQNAALIMIHGPSGGGKTFVALDLCLRIASGAPLWLDTFKVRPGAVVYLAGEGHQGLRARVAAWKAHHNAGPLQMWLSRDGCDLNTPEGYRRVVENVRALPTPPTVIVVDTLHRFLHGDENSASDTKTMLDACGALIKEFNSTVLLVHHTGVSEEAQHRARGSSAWRAALDIEISVIPAKDEAPMQIVQRKSKDAELAPPQMVELQQVTIPGWTDEDGEPVTSAVVAKSDKPPPPSREENKLNQHRHLFESGWWATGAKVQDGFPYVVRAELRDYLIRDKGYTDATATKYLKAGNPGLLITDLKGAGTVRDYADGWVVVDQQTADAMLLARGA